jgi:[NiFe] hydrogenase large subunit
MGNRITIDPIPRIEGHLRIEVEVEGGKVKNAWSSGMLFRGLEIILKGPGPSRRPAHHAALLRCLHVRPYGLVRPRH